MEPLLDQLCRPALIALIFAVLAAVMYYGAILAERAEDNAEETWRNMWGRARDEEREK